MYVYFLCCACACFLYMHMFTCERELLYGATAVPPWCAPLLKPNGAVSGLAHHLHLADESLWWSPVIGGMYWCAHTLKKRGMSRSVRLRKIFSHCYDLLISKMEMLFVQGPQHSTARGRGQLQLSSSWRLSILLKDTLDCCYRAWTCRYRSKKCWEVLITNGARNCEKT